MYKYKFNRMYYPPDTQGATHILFKRDSCLQLFFLAQLNCIALI